MDRHADSAGGRQGGGATAPVTYVIGVTLNPGCEAEFMALLTPVLDAMRHEASFINAVLHRDEADPNRFMLYETWADHEEVVAVQIHRPYRQAYNEALPKLLERPREVRVWRPLRADFAPAGDGLTTPGRAPAAG
jgi:quinol monooxygenase YgiN